MNILFDDILSRIPEPPLWWMTGGVPRWCKFEPGQTGVYDDTVALLRIGCQACARQFDVAIGFHAIMFEVENGRKLRMPDLAGGHPLDFHYGDPPRHDDCGSGSTMNCETYAVLEFWVRGGANHVDPDGIVRNMKFFEWARVPEQEGVLE